MKIDVHSLMQKKLLYSMILVLFVLLPVKGQRHEIGVHFGMSNLVGDIGSTAYLQTPVLSDIKSYGIPFHLALMYRMNFNPYQTLRFNFSYSNVQFIDEFAKEPYRSKRKLWGTNTITEFDAIFEYNFFPVNDEQKGLLSPYIFGGIGGMLAYTPQLIVENDFNRDVNGNAIAPTNSTDFTSTPTYAYAQKFNMAIPFGIGLKYKFDYNWAIFGELMFRATFSDSIDYSVIDNDNVKQSYNKDILAPGKNTSLLQEGQYKTVAEIRAEEIIKNRQVGNTNSKDWVNSISVGVSYSFGRPPCYCSY